MNRPSPTCRLLMAAAAFAALHNFAALHTGVAEAYEGPTTHATLTERAVRASSLGRHLATTLGLPLGLYQVLRIDVEGERGIRLHDHLSRLDPAGGYAPDGDRLPALSWVVAGSVLEGVPASRERNHFIDPVTGSGIDPTLPERSGGVAEIETLVTGGGQRSIPSTVWLRDPDNELGLDQFLDARQRALTATAAVDREGALAEALLIAGALLHVIEDAGDPAFTHDDLRVDLLDHDAPFDTYVAVQRGRYFIPAPTAPARPVAHLADLISAPDGSGLADRTARRFYSYGLLPPPASSDGSRASPEAIAAFDRAAHFHLPPLVAGPERSGYVRGPGHLHLARYTRDASGAVTFGLDDRCLDDYANALLPETVQAALSALEHLFRGALTIDGSEVRNGPLALGPGEVTVLADDARGTRQRVGTPIEVKSVGAGEALLTLPSLPAASTRVVVMYRGVDGANEPLLLSAQASPNAAP